VTPACAVRATGGPWYPLKRSSQSPKSPNSSGVPLKGIHTPLEPASSVPHAAVPRLLMTPPPPVTGTPAMVVLPRNLPANRFDGPSSAKPIVPVTLRTPAMSTARLPFSSA
jgi:hypothetical protein